MSDPAEYLGIDPGLPIANPTKAFWQDPPSPISNTQSSSLPPQADIAIIGSGITGCSVAKSLLEKDPNARIVLLEARTLTSGATGRNGGHLTSSSLIEYPILAQRYGQEMAKKICNFTFQNIELVYQLACSSGADIKKASEVRRVDGISVFLDGSKKDEALHMINIVEHELPEWRHMARFVGPDEARQNYGVNTSMPVLITPAGAMWPYRLVTGVFEKLVQSHPARFAIEANTPVVSIAYNPGATGQYPYTLTTPRGSIQVHQIVHCTNGYASHLLPGLRNGGLFPIRGNMSVQKCAPNFPSIGGRVSWSFHTESKVDPDTGAIDLGLLYMVQNEQTSDIFIGGEKETIPELFTSDDSKVGPSSSASLRSVLPRLFGDLGWVGEEKRVTSSWSGIMGFTGDGLPLVGQVSNSVSNRAGKGEWIAAGFNGYGMANAWLSGQVVVSMMRDETVGEFFPEVYRITESRIANFSCQSSADRLWGDF